MVHVCDFYVTVLLYICLVGDRISVGIYLIFSRFFFFKKKVGYNPPNEYFSIFFFKTYLNKFLIEISYLYVFQKIILKILFS